MTPTPTPTPTATPTATFRAARDFLIEHRADYRAAYAGFRGPDLPVFNWAIDWFDAESPRHMGC